MSINISIECDRCRFIHDIGGQTGAAARYKAAKLGWTRNNKTGFDYCPECSGTPPARDRRSVFEVIEELRKVASKPEMDDQGTIEPEGQR